MTNSPGLEEMNQLRQGGFTEEEITSWKQEQVSTLVNGGFSTEEVAAHFGEREPDMSSVKKMFEDNLKVPAALSPNAPEKKPSIADNAIASLGEPMLPQMPPSPPDIAQSTWDATVAGWQMGATSLKFDRPSLELAKDSPMFHRIAYQMGMMTGDAPEMVAGAIIGGKVGATTGAIAGGIAGSVVPGVGTLAGVAGGGLAGGVIGGGAGAFAAPAMMRKALMEQYEKGDIKTFSDFWERSSVVMLEGVKAGAIGGATAAVGGPGTSGMMRIGAGPVVSKTAATATEIATMVTMGSAIEGHMPNASDFLEAAIVVGALHGTTKTASKLQKIYGETGIRPGEVVSMAEQNPVLKQELLSNNPSVPKSLEPLIEKPMGEPGKTLVNPELTKAPEKIEFKDKAEGESLSIEPMKDRIVSHPERAKEGVTLEQVYTEAFDYLSPLHTMEKVLRGESALKELPIEQSAYHTARLLAGVEHQVTAWHKFGPQEFATGKKTGTRGLEPVLKEMGKEGRIQGREYAVALRDIEKMSQGIETGGNLAEAKAIVAKTPEKIKKQHAEIAKFRDDVLQYFADSGMLSPEKVEQFRAANKDYVPFYRLMDEGAGSKGMGKARETSNPIKEMKGSKRQILDPYESIIKDTEVMVKMAEKNRLLRSIGETVKTNPEMAKELGFEFVEAPKKAIEVKDAEVQKWMKENGIEGEAQPFTVFRKKEHALKENEISYFENGNRVTLKVNKDVKMALDNMDPKTAGLALTLMSAFSKSLKTGVSLSLEFIARNPIRDQLSTFVVSKNGYLPVVDAVRGLGAILTKSEHYQEWLYSRSSNSSFFTFDKKSITQDLAKLDKTTGIISHSMNVVKSPVQALEMLSQLTENATRVGEFIKAREKGKSTTQAAFEARDLLDYAKIGAKAKAVNQIIAYWNAPVQGRLRLIEGIKGDPMGVSARLAASVVVPTLYLWWAQKDDPRYKGIPNWQKDNFQVVLTDKWEPVAPGMKPPAGAMTRVVDGQVEVNNGTVYRIPVPQDTAFVSAAVRRALDGYLKDNPRAFDGFSKNLMNLVSTDYLPNMALPVLEHMANHSFFTERPIVPHGMEGLVPQLRYSPYTTETAKKLGEILASIPGQRENSLASPAIIENYIRQWTGTTGMHVLRVADKALIESGAVKDPKKPATSWLESAPANAFTIRYPSLSDQNLEEFRTRLNSAEMRIKSMKHLAKKGDSEGYQAQYQAAQAEGKLNYLRGADKAMQTQMQALQKINESPLDPIQKRQLMDQIMYGMIEMARIGNKSLDEAEKLLRKK